MARKPRTRRTGGGRASAGQPAVTVRHYCQGIGDCHLLSFPRAGKRDFRMLIDCGIHPSITGGPDLIDAIAADILQQTGGAIDVLVVTHEHWDHVSGFLTAAEIFKDFEFGEVWMAWTEKPGDPMADEFDKHRTQALAALQLASKKLDADQYLSAHLSAVRDGLQSVLGFQFGAAGDRVRAARDAAAAMARGKTPTYLEPGGPPIAIAELPNLRIYVLGPPRDRTLLKLEERASEMYQVAGGGGWPTARALTTGFAAAPIGDGIPAGDMGPFDPNIGHDLAAVLAGHVKGDVAQFVANNYSGPVVTAPAPTGRRRKRLVDDNLTDQSWRRIDADWLAIAADLAMQLDRGVNNTSLVLAFEFTDTGRVMLFPGDAQIGNWLSWEALKWTGGAGEITAADLLTRTVYLKVAHHGSHNATPSHKGLELMTNPDLSAFIPTNELDAKKVKWHEMPFAGILTALAPKTGGRVIRADDAWIGQQGGKPPFATPSGSILAVRSDGGPWVELDLA
jgi:beta-lactamase superfamily II metal-dependent hydrolase